MIWIVIGLILLGGLGAICLLIIAHLCERVAESMFEDGLYSGFGHSRDSESRSWAPGSREVSNKTSEVK